MSQKHCDACCLPKYLLLPSILSSETKIGPDDLHIVSPLTLLQASCGACGRTRTDRARHYLVSSNTSVSSNIAYLYTHTAATIRVQITLVLYLQCSLPTQVQLTFKSKHSNPLVLQYPLFFTERSNRATLTNTQSLQAFLLLLWLQQESDIEANP